MSVETTRVSHLPALWTHRSRMDLVLLGVNAAAQAGAAASSALLVSRGFDQLTALQHGADVSRMARVWVIVLGLGLVGTLAAWLRVDEAVRSQRIGQSYVHRLRLRLWDHLYSTPWSQVARRRRSGILLRFTGDLGSLQKWITHGMIGGGVAVVIAAGALTALGTLSPTLTLGVLAVLLIGTVASAASGRRLRRVVRRARTARSRLIDDVEERVEALAAVQAAGQGPRERRRLVRRSQALIHSLLASARVGGALRATSDLGTVLIVLVVLLVGSYEASTGQSGAGAAVAALVVSRFLVGPLRRVARAHQHWQQSRVAKQKLEGLLSQPAPLRTRRRRRLPAGGDGSIELRRLSIDGILRPPTSLRIAGGSRVLLVGANGAGKSTLLRVVAGLEMPARGAVLIDGQEVSRCRLESLRDAVGFVSSDQPLLRGTVRRNLLYRRPRAPRAEVERVIAAAALDELFPSLEARVARGGMNLSTGQRQRLLLARALVGCPRVLLLDEPEAHLDESGVLVLRRIVDTFPGTVVWATHDLENAVLSTRTWRLENCRLTSTSLPISQENSAPALIDFGAHLSQMRGKP